MEFLFDVSQSFAHMYFIMDNKLFQEEIADISLYGYWFN